MVPLAPIFVPSILNCTPVTATLSEDVAVNVTEYPETVAPWRGAVSVIVGAVTSALTVMLVVAFVEGSVIIRLPGALPPLIVSVAVVLDVTLCPTIPAPVPPLKVNVGLPGVPVVHEVLVLVRVMTLPTVFSVILVGLAEKDTPEPNMEKSEKLDV